MKHLFQFLASFAVAVIISLTISPKAHADGQECKEGQIIDVWETPRGTFITYCQEDPNELYLRTEGKY